MAVEQPSAFSLQHLSQLIYSQQTGFTVPLSALQHRLYTAAGWSGADCQKVEKKMKKSLIFTAVTLLLCGCNLLPSGTPPEGNIIDTPPTVEKHSYTVPEAVDYLISSFTMKAISECPGAEIAIRSNGDSAAYNWAYMVISRSGTITGNRAASGQSPWVMEAKISGNVVKLSLLHNDREVWQESVTVALRSN